MAGDREYVTEEEARRLWQRAAQLQAEAASRAEPLAAWRPGEGEGAAPTGSAGGSPEGYELTHVRAAALEAGIGSEFVDAAVADLRADRVTALGARGTGRTLSGRILGDPEASITVRRTLRATPRQVLDAMESVLPVEPFNLALLDREGDPLNGGVLTFDIQGAGMWVSGSGFLGDASYADLRQVCATLTPRQHGAATELTMRGPVSGAWGWNAVAASTFTLIGGGIGVGAAFGLSALLLPGVGPLVVGAMVAGGGGAGGGLAGYRAIYRHGQKRGRRALVALVSAVAARAEGGWAGPPRPGEPSGGAEPELSGPTESEPASRADPDPSRPPSP